MERVLSLCPVVAGTGLSKDKVIGTEEVTVSTCFDGIHRSRLKID